MNIAHFTFTGSGLGIHIIPTISCVCQYFNKYQSVAMGIAAAGVGMGAFIFPPLIHYLEYHYGWRGALLLMGGISLHLTLFGAFYKPVPKGKPPDTSLDDIPPKQPSNTLNLHIFKNTYFSIVTVQATLIWFGMTVLFVHLPAYIKYLGYSSKEAAFAMSVMGIVSCVGRFLWGALNQAPFVTPLGIYFSAFLILGIFTLILPSFKMYTLVLIYTGSCGLFYGTYATMMPQIIMEALGIEFVGIGLGYQFTITAIPCVIGGPIAGMALK